MSARADPPASARFAIGNRVRDVRKGAGRVVGRGADFVDVVFDRTGATRIHDSYKDMTLIGPWDEGRISPPRGELDDPTRFAPPLSSGERELIEMLDGALEPDWRLYVRPYLDAERPLLAAIHPEFGGMVWDVVDWNPGDIAVTGPRWSVQTSDGPRTFRSPLAYLDEVRQKLYGVYLPAIGEEINDDIRRFGLVRAGLYFENADTSDLRPFMSVNHMVFGRDAVASGTLDRVMPPHRRHQAWRWEWFDEFDHVLGRVYRLPDALSAQPISPAQDRLAQPRAGVDLIEGVAGSGKSVVLAYRAARIAASGRHVLLLTYNRTLTNYLRAILRRVVVAHDPERIAILHYHDLLARIFAHHRMPKPSQLNLRQDAAGSSFADGGDEREGEEDERETSTWLTGDWPRAALEALREHGVPAALRFDAVLFDEGQDFADEYLPVLELMLSTATTPEIVVAIDEAQRVYRRPAALLGGGPWATKARSRPLRTGFRLPGTAATAANAFAALWSLPTAPIEPRDDAILPGRFDWVQVISEGQAAAAVVTILQGWSSASDFLPGRVAVVVFSKPFGEALVRMLAEEGYSTNHVFAVRRTGALLDTAAEDHGPGWKTSQAHKTAFAVSDGRLKVSTVHSFKGWDADRIILVLPRTVQAPSAELISQVYVGLTRCLEDLVVVGSGDGFGVADLARSHLEVPTNDEVVARFHALLAGAKSAGRKPSK